jgi:hypothetical protein
MSTNATVSNTTPTGVIVNSDGTATYAFLQWLRNVGQAINLNFDPKGNYQGPIGLRATIGGRATLASIVANIDTNGVVEASGIDFARAYLNKDTDHIADGFGSPLAGGREAYTALVVSPPTVEPHKFVTGLLGGVFVKSQPGFADVSGTADPGQVPNLSALTGQITTGQLPTGGFTGTIITAQLTTLGTQGSATYVNGWLQSQVAAT